MDTAENAPAIPIACTLTSKDAARQTVEWTEVQGLALDVTPLALGARMTFPASLAAAVQDLARRERECCAFLTITTAVSDDVLTLDVSSENPDALPVIELLAGIPLS